MSEVYMALHKAKLDAAFERMKREGFSTSALLKTLTRVCPQCHESLSSDGLCWNEDCLSIRQRKAECLHLWNESIDGSAICRNCGHVFERAADEIADIEELDRRMF